MSRKRLVVLDPDGTAGDAWTYVVVEAPTGVVYENQYGGTACRHGHVEGFLVPVNGLGALDVLRPLFEKDLRGAGARGHEWTDAELTKLRDAVGRLIYWACALSEDEVPTTPLLDESRLREADEAWLPVITADGPGILVWCNSD
ncbi:DUF6210 family protein [Lentzea sp. NBRC 102530]|uniref:DUF6210 family protein n=1 Tax=Lentzea sp. NBRC 102530 TaxID=3032201 RepID=UPI0025570ED8|nr:DUF6210 family protein [Lentzea sp. NBRC 102530]